MNDKFLEKLIDKTVEVLGQGMGVGGPIQGDGGAAYCICPQCGYKEPHERGIPCIEIICPECGSTMIGTNEERKIKKKEADIKASDVIADLRDTDWGADNEAQMKAVQLLKGLALSDEDISNEFMNKLSDASTDIGNELLKNEE